MLCPDRGYFYRSDQFSFATIGVPALSFSTGTEFIGRAAGWGRQQSEIWEQTRYHQPGDEIDASWNFDGMIQNAQLGFFTGWLIAQADTLPQWNPGGEFEAARRQALAASGHP
jgi:Zn-dependent M28 family amino/carboxypeptidase